MSYYEQDFNYFGESTMEMATSTPPNFVPHLCQLPKSYMSNTTIGLHQSATNNSLINHLPQHQLALQQQPQEPITSDMRTRHASNKGDRPANATQYSNIPFVQIHTTDVGPQRSSYGNSFRRPATNAQIIKSEPIKYETAESVIKEGNTNTSSTNTLLRSTNIDSDIALSNANNDNLANSKPNTGAGHNVQSPIEESTISRPSILSLEHHAPNVYKCMDCHLLTLTERDLAFHQQHAHTDHGIPRRRVPCPGCKNSFFALTVLELHLREDHLMTEPDVLILMNNVNFIDDETIQPDTNPETNKTNTIIASSATNISIQSQSYQQKNLEEQALQEPNINYDVITTTTLSTVPHNQNSNNNDYVHNNANNILSHDDLIVQDKNKNSHNYDVNSNINNNFITYKNNDYNSHDNIDYNTETDCYNENNNINNNNDNNNININATLSQNEQPKRRIYLRNVKYLREPRHSCEQEEAHVDLNDNFFPLYTTPMNLDAIQLSATDLMPLTEELVPEHTELYDATQQNNNIHVNNNITNVPLFKYDASLSQSTPKKHLQSLESKQKIKNTKLVEQNFCNNFMVNDAVDDLQKENRHMYVGDRIDAATTASDINPKTIIETSEKERQRPKIYIKNVDILKEPLLLPEFFANKSNVYTPTSLSVPQPLKFHFMSTQSNGIHSNVVEATASSFIDIAPIQADSLTQSGNFVAPSDDNSLYHESPALTNYLSDNYCTQLDLDLSNMNTFITEPTPSPPDLPTSNSEHNMTLTSQLSSFSSELSNSSSLIADAMLLLQTTPAFDVVNQVTDHSNSITTTAIMSITTTTAAPTSSLTTSCKQKIFIKNVEVLKEPQFQEPRGTLHLRTVDELNLMNKREVENLIAPNLDNTTGYHAQFDQTNQQSENRHTNMELPLSGSGAWTHEADYDLGDDLDYSVMKTSQNNINSNPKNTDDLDTPQISLISIRDIENLSDVVASKESVSKSVVEEISGSLFGDSYTEDNHANMEQSANETERVSLENVCSNNSNGLEALACSATKCQRTNTSVLENQNLSNKCLENINNMPPPLVPMSSSSFSLRVNQEERSLPPISSLPPLVPVSNTIFATNKRITVNSNFLHSSKEGVFKEYKISAKIEVDNNSPQRSIRGRPYGSKNFLQKKQKGKRIIDKRKVCTVKGCGFRFTKPATLEYHQRCHASGNDLITRMICPECPGETYSSWNTLHTHLWRDHEIDMELYSCKLCPFKTPVYSRLANTHMKIHYDERAYNCEQCSKTFKNSKQLKNHRRWHRLHSVNAANEPRASDTEKTLYDNVNTKITISKNSETDYAFLNMHRCNNCDAAFSHAKSLRQHCCKSDSIALKCQVCDRCFSSKSSLRLHAFSHEPFKRFKCLICNYMSNDHNAFRRHKMMHNNLNKYQCPHCSSKFIQSIAYQKHIQQKHIDKTHTLIHKCKLCAYCTINASLLERHLTKHNNYNMKTTINEPPPLISLTIGSEAAETINDESSALGPVKSSACSHLDKD